MADDTTLEAITGNENLLILAPRPGDESFRCGGLIATLCRRGRPPFVMVLQDGTHSHPNSVHFPPDRLANQHDRETRAAVQALGLPDGRLLMAGVYDGRLPSAGAGFGAVVRAVTLVMWARDCNVICAPSGEAWPIAAAVAAESGVGLLAFGEGDLRLDIGPVLDRKHAAIAAHPTLLGHVVHDDPAPRLPAADLLPYEAFRPVSDGFSPNRPA